MKEKRSQDVLVAFRVKSEDISTTDLVSALYPEDSAKIAKILESQTSPQEVRKAKSLKAALHRRILYHINQLVDKGLVRVTRTDANGEKHYSLDLKGNEELLFEDYRTYKLVANKPRTPSLPTEGYEEKRILIKYRGDVWLETANALLLNISELSSLYKQLVSLYAEVNDVIAINNFATHVNTTSTERLMGFCKNILNDCRDFDKRFTIITDVSELTDQGKQRLLQALKVNAPAEHTVKFIFETTPKELQNAFDFFQEIFKIYGNRKVFIRNKELGSAPCIIGKAGPYMLDESEWNTLDEKPAALTVAQTTLMIDVKKFCEYFSFSLTNFEDLINKSLKTLFQSNSIQRRRTESQFGSTLQLANGREAFALSRDYIRFWNYDFLRMAYNASVMDNVFGILKKKSTEFCSVQESIYTSCGMPVRFKAAFSIANAALSNDYFATSLDRGKLEISGLKDFYTDDFRENMKLKEKLVDLFDGGFQLTVHKLGECRPDEAVREVNIILNSYKMPFFAYQAENHGKLKPLQSFVKR